MKKRGTVSMIRSSSMFSIPVYVSDVLVHFHNPFASSRACHENFLFPSLPPKKTSKKPPKKNRKAPTVRVCNAHYSGREQSNLFFLAHSASVMVSVMVSVMFDVNFAAAVPSEVFC